MPDPLCLPLEGLGSICHLAVVSLQNVSDSTLKRVFQYMRSAKLVEAHHYPLEDLDPSFGPCVYKKGNVEASNIWNNVELPDDIFTR